MTNPTTFELTNARFKQAGFTLVELLVTIAVAAVILAFGVPSFQASIASNRLTSLTNDMVGTLAQARSEAIRRGTRVTVCTSANGTACTTSADWNTGWITFVDGTRSGTTAAVDTGETVIRYNQGSGGSTLLRGSTAVAQYVSFASDGSARTMAGTPLTGTLRVCEPTSALGDATRARHIDLSAVGRIETSTPASVASTCAAP
ncbi:GspH/FimT family pseudopilin [Hydrogenophaga sp.]|uniref:GspH/FimT family pseudopilin n=1 Tax=Hydrogenophaga sp. TaxID=1904254 RepID=UPI0025C6ACBC|nr:GspH/FimT family pseudopilin [Hydrogenophaga sp.]